jgi:hypothetical protein
MDLTVEIAKRLPLLAATSDGRRAGTRPAMATVKNQTLLKEKSR